MRVLLTNDSGHPAWGTQLMRRALIEAGLQVVTVAPAPGYEGTGIRSAGDLPNVIERVGADDDNPIYTLDGSPKQCVQVAVGMDLVRNVSVVVAGISDAAMSKQSAATFAALTGATEGALLGYPAIAISKFSHRGPSRTHSGADEIDWCGVIGAELAAWLGVSPLPVRSVLHVSMPGVLRDRRLTLAYSRSDGSAEAAVASGHICIAPANLAGGMGSAVRLFDWARRSIATIGGRIGASDGRCVAGCCV